VSSFFLGRATRHNTAPFYSSNTRPHPVPIPNDDAGETLSNLSLSSRRLISKGLYMQHKRAGASGNIGQLDPVRLKHGRKVNATRPHFGAGPSELFASVHPFGV
jgi:hypothetical protein